MTAPSAPPVTLDPFGRGLLLDDGDLVLVGGDLVGVTGIDNLVQALTLRVLTPFGSDRFNTAYGLDVTQAFTQPHGVAMVQELIKLNLVGTLATDPRVAEVRQVTFVDDPNSRISRAWTVEVELDTVAGNPLTLQVNVEV